MINTCPFFGICGGCKFDFASPDYRAKKLSELGDLPITDDAIWFAPGGRRRADFAFAPDAFGFYMAHSKNIVPVRHCPLLMDEINKILPQIAELPWGGAGSCLVTVCDNGVDVAITSTVPYFTTEFKHSAEKTDAIRITWNGRDVVRRATPTVNFDGHVVEYPAGAFLQPTLASEQTLRNMVAESARGARHTADLFCGLGNFTFALNADGFDIAGIGTTRDLFTHPLTVGMLKEYDCVVMDPPRAGARAQCEQLARSTTGRVIYVSCNPATWRRDCAILTRGGYKMTRLIPVDQFVASAHWELFSVFER